MRIVGAALAAMMSACAPQSEAPEPPPITRAFTIADPLLIPEGIAYDEATGDFYVSSTYQRRIVRVTPDGAAHDFTPRGDGALYGGLGMQVDAERRRLWVAHATAGAGMPIENDASEGRSGLALYDLDSGQLVANLAVADDAPHFLNDLDLAADGSVYVTDTLSSTIYRAGPDAAALEPFATLPGGATGNGVSFSEDERTLYVADARVGVYTIDMATRTAHPLIQLAPAVGADGLYVHDGALIAIEPYRDDCQVCRYTLSADGTALTAREPILGLHPDLLQPT
ncbi:MAG: SMP-30/gluconolactonase/LRE family protein, partial [Hyphomonadaceae bacterium]